MNEVQERLNQFINYLDTSVSQFEQSTGLGNGFVSNTNARMRNSSKNLISSRYPELNMEWLIKGKGEMLNSNRHTINSSGDNSANAIHGNAIVINSTHRNDRIPFYGDFTPSYNNNTTTANLDYSKPSYVDAGDWFDGATSAIRHYDDSMTEYPNGSILVLKKVQDINLLIWGKNYSIETTEYRITRRLQDGGDDFILAYSTNEETYTDGTPVYPPVKIPKSSIVSIDLILGRIIKEHSNNLI